MVILVCRESKYATLSYLQEIVGGGKVDNVSQGKYGGWVGVGVGWGGDTRVALQLVLYVYAAGNGFMYAPQI